MNLYDITVTIGENGFDISTFKSEVVSYVKNGECEVDSFGYQKTLYAKDLGKIKTGLLSAKIPQISVSIIGKESIDDYVAKMKKMLEDELVERLGRTQEQLDKIGSSEHERI